MPSILKKASARSNEASVETHCVGRQPCALLRASDETGQSLIEFALCLPMLMLIVTGLLSFGLTLNNYILLTNATAVGARQLAISRGQTVDPCALVVSAVNTAAPLLTTTKYVFTFVLNGASYSGTTCSSSSTTTGAAANLVQGAPAKVTVTYPNSLGVYGMNFGTGTLQAQTTELVQ